MLIEQKYVIGGATCSIIVTGCGAQALTALQVEQRATCMEITDITALWRAGTMRGLHGFPKSNKKSPVRF